ncbi:MAG TPA: RDD family protein [Candidatus Limnocylindrales bacterium]|nr:RDD family protein [Candidatus Limnocylindrales bacterium]
MTDEAGVPPVDAPGGGPPAMPPGPPLQPGLSSWVVPPPQATLSGWVVPEPVLRNGPAPGYVYVGFWRRFWAFLVDGIILAIPTWLLAVPLILAQLSATDLNTLGGQGLFTVDPTTGQLIENPQAAANLNTAMGHLFQGAIGIWIALFVLQVLYFALFWSKRGATPGQQLLGVQVRDERTGARISLKRALLRYFGYVVSIWIVYIGFIWVAFDSRKQGWHDKIAGTVAVRRVG